MDVSEEHTAFIFTRLPHVAWLAYSLTPKAEVVHSSKTSVNLYLKARRNIPGDDTFCSHRCFLPKASCCNIFVQHENTVIESQLLVYLQTVKELSCLLTCSGLCFIVSTVVIHDLLFQLVCSLSFGESVCDFCCCSIKLFL
jgi:hypothetical protein